jgi:hypothetical protein
MAFSTIFLVMIWLAIALLVLTPLKYYIPGCSATAIHEGNCRCENPHGLHGTGFKIQGSISEGLKKALSPTVSTKDTANLKMP